MVLIILLVLLVGFLVYSSMVDTEVPTQRVEQDVTNEVLAK
jgi:cytochrome c oxidase assembly factor CtaG